MVRSGLRLGERVVFRVERSLDDSFVAGGAWVLPAGFLVAQGLVPCPEGCYPAPGGLPGDQQGAVVDAMRQPCWSSGCLGGAWRVLCPASE